LILIYADILQIYNRIDRCCYFNSNCNGWRFN